MLRKTLICRTVVVRSHHQAITKVKSPQNGSLEMWGISAIYKRANIKIWNPLKIKAIVVVWYWSIQSLAWKEKSWKLWAKNEKFWVDWEILEYIQWIPEVIEEGWMVLEDVRIEENESIKYRVIKVKIFWRGITRKQQAKHPYTITWKIA